MVDIEKPYTPEQVMEILTLKDRDAVYAQLAQVMADGRSLGFKVGRLWRCDPARLRQFTAGTLSAVRVAMPAPSQAAILKNMKSIIKRRSA